MKTINAVRVGDWVAIKPAPMEFGVVSCVCYALNAKRVDEMVIDCVTGAQYVIGKSELKDVIFLKKPYGLRLIKEALKEGAR